MKKAIAQIHLWFSVPIGLVITIICLSGAALVFENEITRLLNSKLYHVEKPAETLPLSPSQLVTRINEQVPDSLHLNSLQLSGREDESYMATFRETGRKRLSINPYTGHVNGWIESSDFFSTMRKLHRWLLDPPASRGKGSVGKIIVGISTIGLVVILVSGLILWIPRSRKALPKRLKVSFSKGSHRFLYDFHISLGFYSALLLLVMALTGLTWSFGWYRNAVYGLFGANQQKTSVHERPAKNRDLTHGNKPQGNGEKSAESKRSEGRPEEEVSEFDYAIWDKVVAKLSVQYPVYKTISLTQTEAQIARKATIRRTDRITFDPSDGTFSDIRRYEDTPRQQRLRSWFYAFHTGSWGGLWTKALYFLAAFIGATLPLTGYYLWWKRTSQKKRKAAKH